MDAMAWWQRNPSCHLFMTVWQQNNVMYVPYFLNFLAIDIKHLEARTQFCILQTTFSIAFIEWKHLILNKTSLRCVPWFQIYYKLALGQIMAWCPKALHYLDQWQPSLMTHVCVTWLQKLIRILTGMFSWWRPCPEYNRLFSTDMNILKRFQPRRYNEYSYTCENIWTYIANPTLTRCVRNCFEEA